MNMAEEELLQVKSVQEIVKTCIGGQVPEKFIHKNGYPQSDAGSVCYMDDSIIDFSLFSSSVPRVADDELNKLRYALAHWGCFQAINHGMKSEFLDEVRQVSKRFFELSLEEKQKYSRATNAYDGYGNDTVISEHQTLDWTDRLYLQLYPEDRRKLKYWPEEPLAFRGVIDEYTVKLRDLYDVLFKAIARSFNLDENCFFDEIGGVLTMDARFNYYPPCPCPEHVLGVKPHADGFLVTVLLSDKDVEGLQVLKDDTWFNVPIIPGALFINVGDLLEIMSNGILKSPVHRVVTNSERERISLAVFFAPDRDREIGPIGGLITDDRPQKYMRLMRVEDYASIFFKYYQLGQRPLDAVRLQK